MSAFDKLAEQLKEQELAKQSDAKSLDNTIEDWKIAVSRLFDEIEGWMTPIIKSGQVTVSRNKIELDETFLDNQFNYAIEELVIQGQISAKLTPKGRFFIGCQGGVDLVKEWETSTIFHFLDKEQNSTWKLRGETTNPRQRPILTDLSEEVFADLLAK